MGYALWRFLTVVFQDGGVVTVVVMLCVLLAAAGIFYGARLVGRYMIRRMESDDKLVAHLERTIEQGQENYARVTNAFKEHTEKYSTAQAKQIEALGAIREGLSRVESNLNGVSEKQDLMRLDFAEVKGQAKSLEKPH